MPNSAEAEASASDRGCRVPAATRNFEASSQGLALCSVWSPSGRSIWGAYIYYIFILFIERDEMRYALYIHVYGPRRRIFD